jgi:ADP-ribose pyrophosphatase
MSPTPVSLGRGKFLELVISGSWEYVRRVRGKTPVGLIALTDDRRILLISQYRIPVGKSCIEIPAGLVGDSHDNEDWQTAARRELREETGYAAAGFEPLTEGPTSAGLTSECILLVRATGLRKVGNPQPDAGERITLHEVPLEKADAFLQRRAAAGDLVDPKVYAALYFLTRDQ